ncbi:hypothetical protein [Streptomyces sp. NRRL F-5065]|uniref:hypothetical protein n=1 Tax=Streptomyces sp. NRRL F-5065 TaxID=1463855 RepID=UPI0004C12E44|nr:hypothetical protein [Streptomyces sp. NRRL F-5065]
MIIRLSRWNVLPEHEEAAVARWEEHLLPVTYADCQGLVEASFLGDMEGTERIAATTWQSLEAYEQALRQGVLAQITDEFRPMYLHGRPPRARTYTRLASRHYLKDMQ